MVRYADDFVVLCRNEIAAQEALEVVRDWTAAAGLTLHPVKTRIVDATQAVGFDFLGYRFAAGRRWPRQKSLDKFTDTIRARTRRVNGQSLQAIITELNPTLRGWFEYFQHGHRFTFTALDKWLRMRLRSLLRFRQGRQGRGRGRDHQRWSNAFFARLGLVPLAHAHAVACQSSRRKHHRLESRMFRGLEFRHDKRHYRVHTEHGGARRYLIPSFVKDVNSYEVQRTLRRAPGTRCLGRQHLIGLPWRTEV